MATFVAGYINDLFVVKDNIKLRVRIVSTWMQELYGKQHVKNMELIVMDEHQEEDGHFVFAFGSFLIASYYKCLVIGKMCVKNGYHETKVFLFDGTVPIVNEEFSDVKEYSIRLFANRDIGKYYQRSFAPMVLIAWGMVLGEGSVGTQKGARGQGFLADLNLFEKILENIATPSKDTKATSSSMVNITPLDLESQTDENTTPVNTLKSIATSLDARLEEYRKRPEDHWRELEAIRILEEDYVHEPEPECDDEDNCYECFDYDDLHLAYPAEKSPKWNF
ncbi:hypothetical protein Tco_1144185 [Tanacetum coccineum]